MYEPIDILAIIATFFALATGAECSGYTMRSAAKKFASSIYKRGGGAISRFFLPCHCRIEC
jgi:hypothetical protein